jgi:hypothetical protein
MEKLMATIKANGGPASVWERAGHHSDDENGHAIEYRDQREAIAGSKRLPGSAERRRRWHGSPTA